MRYGAAGGRTGCCAGSQRLLVIFARNQAVVRRSGRQTHLSCAPVVRERHAVGLVTVGGQPRALPVLAAVARTGAPTLTRWLSRACEPRVVRHGQLGIISLVDCRHRLRSFNR